MNHPIIVRTSDNVNSLMIKGQKLLQLIEKPKPIMWKRGDVYLWIPIEAIGRGIKWWNSNERLSMYPVPEGIEFSYRETVKIPKEAGETIDKYNGHEN